MKDRRKILLVDDTPTFLVVLNNILKNDYETMVSTSGEDALRTALLVVPDLILLDVLMPKMTGYEVLAALKADEKVKHIPVILVSGKDSDEDEAKGFKLGAAGYIKKPFDNDTVVSEVNRICK